MTQLLRIITKPNCKYCNFLRSLLAARQLPYHEIVISRSFEPSSYNITNWNGTFPIVLLDNKYIGGYDDFRNFLISNPTLDLDCINNNF